MARLLSLGNGKQLTTHFSQLPLAQRPEQKDVAGSEDTLNTPWIVPLLPPWDCKFSLSRLEFKGGPDIGRDPLETEARGRCEHATGSWHHVNGCHKGRARVTPGKAQEAHTGLH